MTQRQTLSRATAQVAKQYVARGYELVRKANQDRLPSSLASYSPDLVASRGDERVAVEIVAGPDTPKLKELKKLAEAYRAAGWRLDVVVVAGTPSKMAQPTYLPPKRLRERMRAANVAAAQGSDPAAGLVLVWTVIEASLRHLVEGATGESSPMPLPRLLKEALSLGLLTKRLWTYLGQLLMLRNRLVHGESVAKNVDRKAFERARNLAMRLVDRVGEHPVNGHNGHLQSR